MMSPRIRLVVVDDHALFRRGLVGLLKDMVEFEVVGQAEDGLQALELILRVHPDVILMDVNMPRMDGIQVVQSLRSKRFKARILMLTISQEDDDLLGAIQAGADGYLLKNTEPEDLRRNIIRVAQGQGVLSPEVTATILKAASRRGLPENEGILSDREVEVMGCLVEGQTTLQIASNLFISENTVKTHIRHILEKLDAANRTEAVSKAIQLGLISKKE
jgi:two-component system nitrate/nitrite response regulator NarL